MAVSDLQLFHEDKGGAGDRNRTGDPVITSRFGRRTQREGGVEGRTNQGLWVGDAYRCVPPLASYTDTRTDTLGRPLMTSDRFEANKRNAMLSTGPKTAG